MTTPTQTTRSLKQATATRRPRRRDDRGLTTLEWLLIVAAVAGLAALAVVLVQNVVDDTSEQISGSSARKTAAQVAADEIMDDATGATQPSGVANFGDWKSYYDSACNRLKITYGDAGVTVTANFNPVKGTTTLTTSFLATLVEKGDATATSNSASTGANSAIAECRVN